MGRFATVCFAGVMALAAGGVAATTQSFAADLFVGDFGGTIYKVDTTTGNATVFSTITHPEDLELTQDGHVIAAAFSPAGTPASAKLVLISPDGTTQTDITSAGEIFGGEGPALDANGNLYIQSRGNNGIFFLPRTQASPPIFGAPVQVVRGASLGSAPLPLHDAAAAEGMAVLHTGSFAGDILATAPNRGRVNRFSPGTPYTGPFDFAIPADFPLGTNNGPFDVKQACDGDVYITDGKERLLRYASDGTGPEVLALPSDLSAPPVFIAALPDGIVYFTLFGTGGKLGRYDTNSDTLLAPLQIKNAAGTANLTFSPLGIAGPRCEVTTEASLEKELTSGPDEDGDGSIDIAIEVGQGDTTAYDFTITYVNPDGPDVIVIDLVPGEWDVIAIDGGAVGGGETNSSLSCGESISDLGEGATVDLSRGGNFNKQNCRSATVLEWTPDPDAIEASSILVDVTTRINPGHGNRSIAFYSPTSCGKLTLNDGAVAFELDEIGDIRLDQSGNPVIVQIDGEDAVTDGIMLVAVKDLDGTPGIVGDGSGDEDQDGRTDADEAFDTVNTTDPCNPDSDGDNLSDGEEVTLGNDGFITDPNNPDTDGDGENDDVDADPTVFNDADNDGVSDVNDICPGFDDAIDVDGDGVPAGCDPDDTDPNVP